MLYLVMPDRQMKWTANVGREVLDFAKAEGRDLGTLDWWEPVDSWADDAVIRVALRYGIASRSGIVLDAGHVVMVRRPESMRKTFEEGESVRAKAEPTIRAVDQFIEENMAPGWIQSGIELDARVKESLARSLAEAESDAEHEISRREPNLDLVSHWTVLGGSLPDPL